MKYTVHSFLLEKAIKELDRLAKRADKYGVPFSYTVGEEHIAQVAVHALDHVEHISYVKSVFDVTAVDIEVNCEAIRANGWTVLAKIEHGDKGNIVTAIGGAEIDSAWYTAPARCDHCGTNRVRSMTFMVRHENGEVRQVGRSCLKEYTGIDPTVALMFATVTDLFDGDDSVSYDYEFIRTYAVYYTDEVLALACDEIERNGYRKADSIKSTKDMVFDAVLKHEQPTAKGIAKAKQIIEWLCSIDDNTVGLERDCKALAQSGWLKARHIGRLCYMPVAYDKEMEKREREAKRNAQNAQEAEQSEYIGNIGERITVKVKEMKVITSWETQYGVTHLVKFVDEAGNVLMWRASTLLEVRGHYLESAEDITIKCTVKEHSEYNGIKQTVVARCKAI